MKQLDNHTSNMYLSESSESLENLDTHDFLIPTKENIPVTLSSLSGKQDNNSGA